MPAGGRSVAHWDRYELLELLGKGGMGEVYKARDRRLDRTIAIKFLLGTDPTLTMRFLREARAQARIDHPNVCRVYEVGEVGGHAYIALQFVDGEPLHKAAARMSLDEKVAVMRDVAAAIQEAHRLGIVHRDVKPANIMVERTEDGRWFPVVMDFGLAREVTIESGITESGALLGTPAYMSPEQARGDIHAIDRRSDVYSLGATLYELLTGRPPFLATSLAEALSVVIHDDPPAPRSLVPSLPVDLETITLKSLAKDPRQRYPSARALADDLRCYLDGEPILGRRLSRWQRLRLRARRHRALVTLGAGSLAIILALGAFGARTWIVSRRERERAVEKAQLAERLALVAGRAALKEALWLEPSSSYVYVKAAHLDLVEAAWAAHTGSNSAALLANARADAEKAIALDGQSAEAKLTAAEVCLQIATVQPSREVVDRGIAYVDQALVLNPRRSRAQTVRDALLRLRAP